MINDRSPYLTYAVSLRHPSDLESGATRFFNENANISIVHPFNQMVGSKSYLEHFLLPLQNSFRGLYRRDDIFMSGEFEGQKWVSSTGYYVGQFVKDWIGISATGLLSYLRYGEFHRIKNGKAVQSYIFLVTVLGGTRLLFFRFLLDFRYVWIFARSWIFTHGNWRCGHLTFGMFSTKF